MTVKGSQKDCHNIERSNSVFAHGITVLPPTRHRWTHPSKPQLDRPVLNLPTLQG